MAYSSSRTSTTSLATSRSRSAPSSCARRSRASRARTAATLAAALLLAACGGGGEETNGTSARTTQERKPANGTPTPATTPDAPSCVGAAARAPEATHCREPGLSVVPEPAAAAEDRGTPCERTEPLGLVTPCAFGVPAADARLTFALLGDSHAAHLRPAFDLVAREQRWRGYALTRNGCPFVSAGRPLPEPEFSRCDAFKRQVPRWLERHPEVSTVFVIGLPRNAAPGDPVPGHLAAWRRLPPSVKRIVVIRDTPETREDVLACVEDALERKQPSGPACATPRAAALAPDPAVTAAARVGAPVIDLTHFFCDARECFPVVGDVLAYKDLTHLTPRFAATLGPFLLAEIRRLGAFG